MTRTPANDAVPDPDSSRQTLRDRIDALDREILSGITARTRAVGELSSLESASDAEGSSITDWSSDADAQRLAGLVQDNAGPFDDATLQHIFREIYSATHALTKPLQVAFLGPEGTYSHAATERHFGHAVDVLPQASIADIFRAVEGRQARFGVVPIENSTEGTINQTLDLLMATSLRIAGEVRLRIEHQLLSHATELETIVAVHAHPQSLAQCRLWLDTHLKGVAQVAESSNAAAARLAAESGQPGMAAIAGTAASERYAIPTLVAGIEDIKNNTTRFIVVSDHDAEPTGRDTTSLLIGAPHRPGGLLHMLEPFEAAGVSMTRIESRPSRDSLWDYVFFIDVEGHQQDATLAPVIAELRSLAPRLRVLGSYPAAL